MSGFGVILALARSAANNGVTTILFVMQHVCIALRIKRCARRVWESSGCGSAAAAKRSSP